jgi:hypothetical protein
MFSRSREQLMEHQEGKSEKMQPARRSKVRGDGLKRATVSINDHNAIEARTRRLSQDHTAGVINGLMIMSSAQKMEQSPAKAQSTRGTAWISANRIIVLLVVIIGE